MKIQNELTEYFCDTYKIDKTLDYTVEEVDAKTLLTGERLDLVAKIKYIECREKGQNTDFIKELYKSHIEAFTFGIYAESGNQAKNSIDKYFETFDHLIDTIKHTGFDAAKSVVPVGKDNVIMDGAHRTAIAIYFGLKLPIIRFPELYLRFDAEYFRKRLLDEKYIDYLVLEYCKMNPNTYFASVWPAAGDKKQQLDQMLALMEGSCKIIYTKKINMGFEALNNFIAQVYMKEDWTGTSESQYEGSKGKTKNCFLWGNVTTIYILESPTFEAIFNMKQNIREIFKIGTHSIHITDNQAETIRLANLTLNRNSLDYLFRGKPLIYTDFNKKVSEFKAALMENHYEPDDFIVASSGVLGVYGLRDIGDIDFFTLKPDYEVLENDGCENNQAYAGFYDKQLDDLIYNPDNYLVYNDIKFITLDVLQKYKAARNRDKDMMDLKLIAGLTHEDTNSNAGWSKSRVALNREYRIINYRIRAAAFKALKQLGLYSAVRQVYRGIKGKN